MSRYRQPSLEMLEQRDTCSVSVTSTVVNGITEVRLYKDNFHFATVLRTTDNLLALRTHPDPLDPNGWGTSVYLCPHLSGGASIGSVTGAFANQATQTITIQIGGEINSGPATSYGSWTASLTFSYDASAQTIQADGQINVALAGTLAAAARDLNLNLIASNYLIDVPLQTGGTGNTGDMDYVRVQYAQTADPRDFTWQTQPTAHYPTDSSPYSSVTVAGALNTVNTQALGESQIAVARKPGVRITYASATNQNPIAVGMQYDIAESKDAYADNVGIHQQVRQFSTSNTNLTYDLSLESSPINVLRHAGTGDAGQVFALTETNQLWWSRPGVGWFSTGGSADQIAMGNTGDNNAATDFVAARHAGNLWIWRAASGWQATGGSLASMSTGDSQVLGLTSAGNLWRYRVDLGAWTFTGGAGQQFTIGNVGDGDPANDFAGVLSAGSFWLWRSSAWTNTGGALTSVSGGDGQVYGLAGNGALWTYRFDTGWANLGGYSNGGLAVGGIGDRSHATDFAAVRLNDRVWIRTASAWIDTLGSLTTMATLGNDVIGTDRLGGRWVYRINSGWSPLG